jgi:hypothetical protein
VGRHGKKRMSLQWQESYEKETETIREDEKKEPKKKAIQRSKGKGDW